jgi:hypothetical membrane protein
MLNFLASLFLGWPAILATVVLALIGLFRRDYRFLVIAAILAVPFSWALSGLPVVSFPACLSSFMPLLLFTSGFLIYRQNEMVAWILAIVFFLMILLLLVTLFGIGAPA